MPIIHPFIRHVHRFIIDCFSGQVRKLTRVIVIVQLATSFDWTMKPTRSGWPWPPTVGPGRRRRTKTALLIAYSQINRAATDGSMILVVQTLPSCSGDISAPGRSFLHTARSKPYQVRYRLHISMRAVRSFTAL